MGNLSRRDRVKAMLLKEAPGSHTHVSVRGKDGAPARSPQACPRRNRDRDRPTHKGPHWTAVSEENLSAFRRAHSSIPGKLSPAPPRDVAGALGGSAGKPGSTARWRSRAKRGGCPDGDAVGLPERSPNGSTQHSNHPNALRIEWN